MPPSTLSPRRVVRQLADVECADVVMKERVGEHGGPLWAREFPLMVAWAFGR